MFEQSTICGDLADLNCDIEVVVLLTRYPELDFCVPGYFRMLLKMDDKILSEIIN